MPMNIRVSKAEIEGPVLVDPEFFEDARGFFFESYSKRRLMDAGYDIDFLQDNHSRSAGGVVRGFHFQDSTAPQWRLVRCTVGRVWDVVVDLRLASATFGRWFAVELTAHQKRQLLIPPEFAHGFCALTEFAEVQYKCSGYHTPEAEKTLAWNDPEVAVRWPVDKPVLSERDRTQGQPLSYFREHPPFP